MRLLFLTAVFGLPVFAEESSIPIEETPPEKRAPAMIEAKGGYLFFQSHKMREVYGNGSFEVQISGSYPIRRSCQVYGSVGFLEAWGTSLQVHQKTVFWRIPVDLGLKPIVSIGSFVQWYAAFGPRYFYAHQHNHSSFVNRRIGKSGIGAFANTGFNFFPISHFLIDVFAEYSYEPIRFSSSKASVRNLQVGGFYLGAGLGYAF